MAYSAPGYKQSGPIGLKIILILSTALQQKVSPQHAQITEY